MKKYEKPVLMSLSLSGNDQLCGSCSGGITLYDDPGLAGWLMNQYGFGNSSDGIDRGDFSNVFGEEKQCLGGVQIKSYCKFTSTGPGIQMVAWS